MTSTSFHPSGVRTRSSIGVPTVLPWMLVSATAATSWSSGWRKSSPSVPARRVPSTPNSRSAASLAQISRAEASITTTASGSQTATSSRPRDSIIRTPSAEAASGLSPGLGSGLPSRRVDRAEVGPGRPTPGPGPSVPGLLRPGWRSPSSDDGDARSAPEVKPLIGDCVALDVEARPRCRHPCMTQRLVKGENSGPPAASAEMTTANVWIHVHDHRSTVSQPRRRRSAVVPGGPPVLAWCPRRHEGRRRP